MAGGGIGPYSWTISTLPNGLTYKTYQYHVEISGIPANAGPYDFREGFRLQDQASTLTELLHSDTAYPAGSRVLEAGRGVGAQTIILAKNNPGA